MHSTLRLLLLLSAVCAAFSFHAPVSGGGSYTLPKTGNFPAPQPTFPRNRGLPDVYKQFRRFRSVDGHYVPDAGHFDGKAAFVGHTDEVYRQPRSIDEFLEMEPSSVNEQAELARQRRSSGYKIIRPTYRPPPRGKPKIYIA